jgi:5-methylcytosine-specific restriction enzyme A
MLDDIKQAFEGAFEVPFQVSYVNDGKGTSVRVGPEDPNRNLFSLLCTFPDNVRLNVEFEPHTFSKPFIEGFSSVSSESQNAFYSFLALLVKDKVSFEAQINGKRLSPDRPESFPQNVFQFSFSISKAPIENSTEEAREKLIDHYGIIVMGAMLSLAHIKESSNVDSESLPEGKHSFLEPEVEGNKYVVSQNKYERSAINRLLCLEAKGYRCAVCGMSFEESYGEIGKDYIQVHHIVPVSQIGPDYHIDPEKDLVPVCANCHAMLHRKNPPYTPDELKEILQKNKK